MPVLVIDVLEKIDIDQRDGQGLHCAPTNACHFALHDIVDMTACASVGQCIDKRDFGELALAFRQPSTKIGNVAAYQRHPEQAGGQHHPVQQFDLVSQARFAAQVFTQDQAEITDQHQHGQKQEMTGFQRVHAEQESQQEQHDGEQPRFLGHVPGCQHRPETRRTDLLERHAGIMEGEIDVAADDSEEHGIGQHRADHAEDFHVGGQLQHAELVDVIKGQQRAEIDHQRRQYLLLADLLLPGNGLLRIAGNLAGIGGFEHLPPPCSQYSSALQRWPDARIPGSRRAWMARRAGIMGLLATILRDSTYSTRYHASSRSTAGGSVANPMRHHGNGIRHAGNRIGRGND